MSVREEFVYASPLHIVRAGEIPNYGVAIKGDSVYFAGREIGTLMRVVQWTHGAGVHYLASDGRRS